MLDCKSKRTGVNVAIARYYLIAEYRAFEAPAIGTVDFMIESSPSGDSCRYNGSLLEKGP